MTKTMTIEELLKLTNAAFNKAKKAKKAKGGKD